MRLLPSLLVLMLLGGCVSNQCKPIPFPEPPASLMQPPRQIKLIPRDVLEDAALRMVPQTR